MIKLIDTEALRAKRDAIEQEIVRHREAIAALEQRRSELEIGERVIAEFATEQHRGVRKEEAQERTEPASTQDEAEQKRPRKPAGLPIMPDMIIAAFRDARARGVTGMEPADITSFIRRNYWPEVPPEAVTPIVWRMWKKDGALEKNGSHYALPTGQRTHNGADDLLSKTGTPGSTEAGLQ